MLRKLIIKNINELIENQADWNDLWVRSNQRSANHRAEIVGLNAEHFFEPNDFRALAIYDGQQMVAALPLRMAKRLVLGSTGYSLGNPCSPVGTLLLDHESDLAEVGAALVSGLRTMGLDYLKLDWFDLTQAASQWLVELASSNGLACWTKKPHEVAVIQVPTGGNVLEHASSNHRKKLRRWRRDLEGQGAVCLEEFSTDSPVCLEAFGRALEIELASWKGAAGSAILSNKNENRYWNAWRKSLSKAGLFRLYQLKVGDRPIAFDFGYQVGDVYTSVKISHLEEFAQIGVGHVRDWLLLERLSEQNVSKIDTLAANAEIKWPCEAYSVGRVVMSLGSWLGDAQVTLWGAISRAAGR
jgi:CelD/BcsL family acetyltransferase involved in cellulose biosynthesis